MPGVPPDSAKGKLGAFINEVEAMIKSKKLDNEEGQELISAAQDILENVNSLSSYYRA